MVAFALFELSIAPVVSIAAVVSIAHVVSNAPVVSNALGETDGLLANPRRFASKFMVH